MTHSPTLSGDHLGRPVRSPAPHGREARRRAAAESALWNALRAPATGLGAALVLAPLVALACAPEDAAAWGHRGVAASAAVESAPSDTEPTSVARSSVPHARTSEARAPEHLADTGLYADFAAKLVRADALPYTPRYPLWSDGATKRRWIALPAGASIDGANPDVWDFPIGTKVWKEFSFGRRVETRYLERAADGAWIYATYLWNADETDAVRAPDAGVRAARGAALRHDVPSRTDCLACHEGSPVPVLGVNALQLASARDPLAPHGEAPLPGAVDARALVERGLLRLERAYVEDGDVAARTPRERAALGYLHGNCGGCHNAQGPLAALGLELDLRVADRARIPALRTALDVESKLRRPEDAVHLRIASGAPERSLLVERMSSRFGALQMPPLGTHVVDEDALALVTDWIREDLAGPRTAAETPRR